MGVMIETPGGRQPEAHADLKQLTYGQSVTDACISLETTQQLLDRLSEAVATCCSTVTV